MEIIELAKVGVFIHRKPSCLAYLTFKLTFYDIVIRFLFLHSYFFILTSYLLFLKVLVAQSSPNLWNPMDCSPPGSYVHGNSPGKNIGVGCHFLLQGIFQGSNPCLLHWQADSLPLSHMGSPDYALNIDTKAGVIITSVYR